MQRKNYILPYTLFVISLIFCLLFIGSRGWLGFFENSLQLRFFSVGALLHTVANPKTDSEKIKAENIRLFQELAQKQLLENDNKALRDQFETSSFATTSLLPARVVGQPSAVPNISLPEELIIDKGRNAGVVSGSVVIVKDNGVGQVTQTSDYFGKVMLVTSKQFALSGKDTATGAVGIIKGIGNGEIIFDAVLLSDTLRVGDTIASQGSQDMSGKGFPPNVVIGKITGVEKSPSSLFQRARVAPLLDLSKLSLVFVLKSL